MKVSLSIGAAVFALAALVACSPPATKTEEATPEAAAPAAPAPAAAPAAAATPVALDIKDAAGAQLSGDPAKGEIVFHQCQTCHTIDPGVNRVGPSLHGIIGRHSGSVEGFHYSDANKNSGKVWSEQELYTYLENPRAAVPGTTMTFVGVRDSQQRADLIAFLKERTK